MIRGFVWTGITVAIIVMVRIEGCHKTEGEILQDHWLPLLLALFAGFMAMWRLARR